MSWSYPECAIDIDFYKDTLDDSQILKSLTDWIEMYLQATESNDSQWWDMYVDEREFWDELPAIIEALLRRGSVLHQILVLISRELI